MSVCITLKAKRDGFFFYKLNNKKLVGSSIALTVASPFVHLQFPLACVFLVKEAKKETKRDS